MISAMYTHGNGWAAEVKDETGQPLFTPEETVQLSAAARPYVQQIISFLGNKKTGGQAPAYDLPDAAKLADLNPEDLDLKTTEESSDPETMMGIDNIYAKVVQRLGSINSAVNDYASKYGVLHMEKKSDVEPDVRLIPQPIAQLLSKGLMLASIPPQVSMDFMNKIKVPFRMIVFMIYLFLDVARITASVTGSDSNRKILSIAVALLDFLKGDWKKAILSFMGYYGTTPLLLGNMGKIYLTMFQTLSPTIQESMIYGVLDSTKSFMIGVLLAIFKITAPEGVRLPLIGMLEKIAKKKAEIDGTLTEAGLSARSDSFAPTFEDFNNIQTLMDDPEFICSTEFETLIEQVNNTAIINMILQILRIPVTKEFRAYRCGTKASKPFLTLIVEKAKEDKKTHDVLEKPFSTDDLNMPVSVKEDAVEEKKEDVVEEKKEDVVEEKKGEEKKEDVVEEKKEEEKKEEAQLEEKKGEEKKGEEKKEDVVEEKKEAPVPPTIAKGGTRKRNRRPRRTIRAHQ